MESTSKFLQFMNDMNNKKITIDDDNDKTEDDEDPIEINFFNKKLKGKNKKFGARESLEYNQWISTAGNSVPNHVSSNLNDVTEGPIPLEENDDFDICSIKVASTATSTNVIAIDANDDTDNDDDMTTKETVVVESKTSNAFEIAAENIECKISVMDWIDNTVNKFVIRKFQPISKIQKLIAEKHGLPPSSIILEYESITLSETDSPHSIGYVIGTKIEALRKTKNASVPVQQQSQPDTNKINLRFRCSESRYPINLALNPSDPMKIAMAIVCERLELDPKRVQFQFEGETIQFDETPESLDMADDDVIDIDIC